MNRGLHSIILNESFIIQTIENREGGVFCTKLKSIHAETVNAFIQPEFHDVINLLTQFWIFPVKVRLFAREIM